MQVPAARGESDARRGTPQEASAEVIRPAELPAPSHQDAATPAHNEATDAATVSEDDDIPAEEDEPSARPENTPAQPGAEDSDRWAGTMSREWSESDSANEPGLPAEAAKKKKAKAKPRITIEEAAATIPPSAIQFIREKFKTDIHHLRSYDPSRNVKNAIVLTSRSVDTAMEEDLTGSESE